MKLLPPAIRKRTVIWTAGVVGGLLLLIWVLVHLLVDTDRFREELIANLEEISGYKTQIREAELSVFPLPSIILNRVTIDNSAESTNSYFFETSQAELHISIFPLFAGKVVPYRVDLVKPRLTLERFSPDRTNWQSSLKLFDSQFGRALHRLRVQNGAVLYSNIISRQTHEATDISGSFAVGAKGVLDIDTRFSVFERDGEFRLTSSDGSFRSLNEFDFQIESELKFGDEFLSYRGRLGRTDQFPWQLNGSLQAEATQTSFWLEKWLVTPESQGALSSFPKNYPLKLEANIRLEQGKGEVGLSQLAIGNTQGKGQFNWDEAVRPSRAVGRFDFARVDLDEMLAAESTNESINAFFGLLLPRGVSGTFDAKAEALHYRGIDWQQAALAASLEEGELVINQGSARLPGGTQLIGFGILKQDPQKRINFDGSVEMLGDDVIAFLDGIGLRDAKIVPPRHVKFRARANLFLAPDQGTISEMRFEAGDFYVAGGINLSPSTKYDMETTLLFRHASLDPLLMSFQPILNNKPKETFDLINRRLPWLEGVDKSYYFNLLFEDFSVGQKQGARSQFIVSMKNNRIELSTIDVMLEGQKIDGRLAFDQNEDMPSIEGDLHFSTFDLSTFFSKDIVNHPVPRGNRQNVWSTERFELDFLRGYSSNLNLVVDRAVHPDFVMDNLILIARAENGEWTIDQLSADIWGGKLSASGSLQATAVAALSGSFYITGARGEEMFKSLADFESLRGNIDISGEMLTSGIHPYDWVRNMSGTIAFRGSDVVLRSFDLASLVQTIPSVRTVADVVNTSRLATLRGQSTFSVVEGGFYFYQGRLATNGVTFRSRHAIGNLQGGIDLVNWMLDAGIAFKLTTIARQEYPTVTVLFRDSMDNPIVDLDTRSLESFVARRKLVR